MRMRSIRIGILQFYEIGIITFGCFGILASLGKRHGIKRNETNVQLLFVERFLDFLKGLVPLHAQNHVRRLASDENEPFRQRAFSDESPRLAAKFGYRNALLGAHIKKVI